MPTDNVLAEREFAKFDHVARVAKFRNQNFTAKGIRADMVLYKSADTVVQKAIKEILVTKEDE